MSVHVRNKTSAARKGVASNGVTLVTVYTFGTNLVDPDGSASGQGGIVKRVRIFNSDTIAHTVKLHLVPNGGSAGNDTLFYNRVLAPGEVDYCSFVDEAADGDFIQVVLGEAISATQVFVKPVVSEMKTS